MKNLKKMFIMFLVYGILMCVSTIVMKVMMHGLPSNIFTYLLCGGIALAAVGLIGTVAVSVKEKKTAEPDGKSNDKNTGEQSADAETQEEEPSVPTQRVTGVVALSGGDSWRIKAFGILTAMYVLILIVSLIGFFTGFGIKNDDGKTLCKAICLAYAFITPSYFVYFGFANPFHLPKAVSVGIAVFGIVAMVICFVVGLVSISNLPEVENGFGGFICNIFIPLAIACAVVGYGVIYGSVCRGASSVWYLGLGVGMTVLFPVVAALVAAVIVISFLIGAIKWILSSLGIMVKDTGFGRGFISGWTGKIIHKNEYTYTDENGYTHTVYSDNGTDFYGSDGSYAGHSDDGGRHIS